MCVGVAFVLNDDSYVLDLALSTNPISDTFSTNHLVLFVLNCTILGIIN